MGGISEHHRSVLLGEAIELLAVSERAGASLFIDATLGLGGHSEAILQTSPAARVIGIDRDPEAIRLARTRLEATYGDRFRAVCGNFFDITRIVREAGAERASGVLADLGVSSLQLDTPERGFSFRHDAPLDMRMNASEESDEETVAELLARIEEEDLARIIYEYGEEPRSRKIARWIVEKRRAGEPVRTTAELAALVARATGHRHKPSRGERVHPATRTFQALRIAVNHELEELDAFVEQAIDLLEVGGRFVAISFHSLEDRIIKRALRRSAGHCECEPRIPVCRCGARRVVQILTRRPLVPSSEEIEQNPRARSAKLRACQRVIS